MADPVQHYKHAIDIRKGWMPGDTAPIDKTAYLSPNVTIDPVFAGRVVHLNSVGEWEMGATGIMVPCWLLGYSNDTDVSNDGGAEWTGIISNARVNLSALVGLVTYEAIITEFDDTRTYAIGDPLRAVASNTVAATGGLVTNAGVTPGTNCICGIVTEGESTTRVNRRRTNTLMIWTHFERGTTGN